MKQTIVGLDLGTSSVKIAQFTSDGRRRLLRADVKERTASVKEWLRGIDVKNSKFIVAVNCPRTSIRFLTVPCMPLAELAQGIRFEAGHFFPFPIDDACLAFTIEDTLEEKGVKKYRVLAAVSPKETVRQALDLLRSAGVVPDMITPVSYGLQKWARSLGANAGGPACFVDIGERYTEVLILPAAGEAGGSPSGIFSRKISLAGADFTKAMTETLGSERGTTQLSWEEAERIKRQIGMPAEGQTQIIENDISAAQILGMVREPAERLAHEINQCFSYYLEEAGAGRIDRVVLSGGGASLKGLDQFLSGQWGMPVEIGDSLKELTMEPGAVVQKKGMDGRLAPAVGAALSLGEGANLVPPEIREKTKRTFIRAGLKAAAAAAALLCTFIYVGMTIQLTNFQKRTDVAQWELKSLAPGLEKVRMQDLVNTTLAHEPYWEDVFKELSNVLPRETYLTDIRWHEGSLFLKGVVLSRDKEALISQFIQALEKGIFRNVSLVRTQELPREPASEFELKAALT